MPCPLLSQDYSTNTFVDGVDIADRGVGMDPLTCTKHVLTQELQELQELVPGKIDVCFQPGLFSSGAQGLDRRISCFHESQRILTLLSCFCIHISKLTKTSKSKFQIIQNGRV